MTGPLRALLQRPVGDDDRHRLFAVAAGLLLTAAVALSLVADQPSHVPPSSPATAARPTAPPAPSSPRSATLPDRPPRDVLAVARRFLGGYLARLYGHDRDARLAGATRRLRRRLAARTGRVAAGMRDRRPRVEELEAARLGQRWLVRATVTDGSRVSFPIEVVVAARGSGGPVVTRVVED